MKVIAFTLVAGVAVLGLSGCDRGAAGGSNASDANIADSNMIAPDDNVANAAETDATNTATPAPSTSPTPVVADFPVRTGRYAANMTCKEAAASDDYVTVSRKTWGEIDGDSPIGPVRNLGGNRWSLGSGLTITVVSPTSFTENGRKMTWCKA